MPNEWVDFPFVHSVFHGDPAIGVVVVGVVVGVDHDYPGDHSTNAMR